MKKLQPKLYEQIATNLIESGFRGVDIRVVEQIHADMQGNRAHASIHTTMGRYAIDMIEQAEKLPEAFLIESVRKV